MGQEKTSEEAVLIDEFVGEAGRGAFARHEGEVVVRVLDGHAKRLKN